MAMRYSIGISIDTFHELVSKLKEKKRELEVLRQKAEDRASAVEGYNESIPQSTPTGMMRLSSLREVVSLSKYEIGTISE